MKTLYTLIVALMLFTTSGCSMVEDAVAAKWKDEWKPLVLQELKMTGLELKDEVLKEAQEQLDTRLAKLDVDPSRNDWNQDGKLQWDEGLALLKEMKAKNDQSPEPYSLIELAALFAAIYGGGSVLKGGTRTWMKSREVLRNSNETSA